MVEIVVDQTGQQYAHKAFRKYYGRELKRVREEFRNEIEIIKRLRSNPHIIQVFGSYACGRDLGMLLLPVANGGDLKAYLEDIKDIGTATIPQRIILSRCIGCLASGLAFIHRHTIRHKDIKPSNILMHDELVIYTDFGISLDATHLDDTTTTGYHGAMTERYCAPEVAHSAPRNRKSDVFSLGCVYIEIFTVLYPKSDLGDTIAKPYWQKSEYIRNALAQLPGDLPRTVRDMLEPSSARRIGAEELCQRLLILPRDFGLFCDKCVPKTSSEPNNNQHAPTSRDRWEPSWVSKRSRNLQTPNSFQFALLVEVERPPEETEWAAAHVYIFTSPKWPNLVRIGVTTDVFAELTEFLHGCRLPVKDHTPRNPSDERRRVRGAARVKRLVETEFKIQGKQQDIYCECCQFSHVGWFRTTPQHAKKVVEKFADWMDTIPYEYDARQNLWVLTEYAKRHDLERICSLTAE